MGNRTGLWMERDAAEPVLVFEANNALPLFWCAAFQQTDLDPWAEHAQAIVEWDPTPGQPDAKPPAEEPLVLRASWATARNNVHAALARAQSRMPGFETRLAAFATALESEANRLAATHLVLDAAEWANFYAQPPDASNDVGLLIAAWHGDEPSRMPSAQPLQWIHQVDGSATDQQVRRAQRAWPAVPLVPPPSPAPPSRAALMEWAWIALICAAVIGTYAATRSTLAACGAFALAAGVFLWSLLRGR